MPLPNFNDRTLFPSFNALPDEDSGGDATWTLLAEVKDNMTITKPTLVLSDRDGRPFALIFDGIGHDELDLTQMGLRKGATAVVRGARRTVPATAEPLATDNASNAVSTPPAKRSIVRIPLGQAHTVRAVPAPLEQVLAAANKMCSQTPIGEQRCDACGATSAEVSQRNTSRPADAPIAGKRTLLKCTGCEQAWYCNCSCQKKHWMDGHKTACKATRGVMAIWGTS